MPFAFKIWDQANDGQTMGVRVDSVDELDRLAAVCVGPDAAGNWGNLREHLDYSSDATVEPVPYVRDVDVLWLGSGIVLPYRFCQHRRLRVTYTGRVRVAGGFASQGYCIVDPGWNAALQPHHQEALSVELHAGDDRDLMVVLP